MWNVIVLIYFLGSMFIMKNTFLLVILAMQSSPALAFEIDFFRQADGHTNWQYLANYMGSTLLILLTIVSVYLFIARRKAYKANSELTAIRNELEKRVAERTETLNESNKLLLDSNILLEEEVSRHVVTTKQLKSSESYIKDILISMPLMLVGLDRNGCITHWNKQVEDVSGISVTDSLGKALWDVYPQMTVLPEHVQKSIEDKEIIYLKKSLRSVYHYDIIIYPLNCEDSGVVILVDDVSKQTAAENMLIHNDKISFMAELASSMAHDINLPLQSIMMEVRRFQRLISVKTDDEFSQVSDSDQAYKLNTIASDMSDKAEQVSTIINNLLAFSRSQHSEKQMANIVDVMENTISLANEVVSISEDLTFKNITLEKNFEKNISLVPCYITELQQVFLSLFRHASYALGMKNKSVSFEPLIKIILSESYDNVWIKVQHNGCGLTTEEQMSLFEPLFTDKSSTEKFDAGERLSFSYYIITEQHQGNMAVTSDIELGSTIHIQLPIRG